jgi:hypothetical protein
LTAIPAIAGSCKSRVRSDHAGGSNVSCWPILLKKSAHAHFLKAADALDAIGCGGTTSIYARSLGDLPSLVAKAFIAKIRSELISARFLLSRYFRIFQRYFPFSDIGAIGFDRIVCATSWPM